MLAYDHEYTNLKKKIIILSLCLHFFFVRPIHDIVSLFLCLRNKFFLSMFRSILKVPFNSRNQLALTRDIISILACVIFVF